MRDNEFPIIEGGPIPEYFVDGVHRIDQVGPMVHVNYFQFVVDPNINGGMPFRVPVVKHIRSSEALHATAGVVKDWLTFKTQPPLLIPKSFIRRMT